MAAICIAMLFLTIAGAAHRSGGALRSSTNATMLQIPAPHKDSPMPVQIYGSDWFPDDFTETSRQQPVNHVERLHYLMSRGFSEGEALDALRLQGGSLNNVLNYFAMQTNLAQTKVPCLGKGLCFKPAPK